MKPLTPQQWGYLTLRLTLGINMLMHGLTRIISGVGEFAEMTSAGFADSPMPLGLAKAFLIGLPFIELIIGAMMVVGLFTRYALIAGGFLITLLTFGSTAQQNWSAAGVQLPYAIAFSLLLFGLQYNRIKIRD